MKNNIIFIVFILIVVGFLLSISGKKYPQIPATKAHLGITEAAACLTCHGPDGERPRKPAHPPKDDCLKCHKKKRVKPS
ncbi:MAG: c-type cytochrome [Thermodesulfovibrionales bacterium]